MLHVHHFYVVLSVLVVSLPDFKFRPKNATKDYGAENSVRLSEIVSYSFEYAVEGTPPWNISNFLNESLQNSMSAEWMGSKNELVFTSEAYLPTNFTTVVTIPESYKFMIPEEGVHVNSKLTLEANLLAGYLNKTRIQHVMPVGRLWNTSLLFEGAAPSSKSSLPCEIIISFVNGFQMLPGDLFMINLPGFMSHQSSFNVSSSPNGVFITASWEKSSLFPLSSSKHTTSRNGKSVGPENSSPPSENWSPLPVGMVAH